MDYDFDFKKSLGQNFLIDDNIINKILNNSLIDKDTLVMEIGAGSGNLSSMIVPFSGYSILYEIDNRLKDILYSKLNSYDNFEIVFNDFLKEDIKSRLSKFNYKKLYVISNLPYYITTPIINKFLDDGVIPDKLVLMVQKEAVSRICATVIDNEYSALNVILNYFYNISKLFDVSRNSFFPKPNIDSSVIQFELRKEKMFLKNFNLFKNIVNDAFKYKRKNLRNNLKNYDLLKIEKILNKYGLNLSSRAHEVDVEVFVEISNELSI